MERLVEISDELIGKIASIRREERRAVNSLIVEDDENDRELARRALLAAGHEVQTARNGEEAFAAIEAQKKRETALILCLSTLRFQV